MPPERKPLPDEIEAAVSRVFYPPDGAKIEDEVVKKLEERVARDPEDFEAWLLLGDFHCDYGERKIYGSSADFGLR